MGINSGFKGLKYRSQKQQRVNV